MDVYLRSVDHCSLRTMPGEWYIIFTPLLANVSTVVNFTATLEQAPNATLINSGEQVSVSLPDFFDASEFQFNMPSPNGSQWVYIESLTSTGALPIFTADGTDSECSTIDISQYGQRFRNMEPNSYLASIGVTKGFEDTGKAVNITFVARAEPVSCQVPTTLSYCDNVNWPIADFDFAYSHEQDVDFLISAINPTEECLRVLKPLSCATALAECDNNGFDRPACKEDCEALKSSCIDFSNIECPTENPPNARCYLEPESTTQHGSTTHTSSNQGTGLYSSMWLVMAAVTYLLFH